MKIVISGARGRPGPQGEVGPVPNIVPKFAEHTANGTLTLNYSQSADWFVVLKANITQLSVTNLPDDLGMRIALLQDSTGGRTVTLDPAWVEGDTEPTISINPLTLSVITVENDGTDHIVSGAVPSLIDYGTYLPLAGGNLAGNLTIAKASPVLGLDTESADQEALIEFRRNNVVFWKMGKDAEAHGGSDAGSDFYIQRRDNTGAVLNKPITIDRQTGTITFDNYFRTKGRKRLEAQFDKTGSTSLSNVTNLSLAVLAGKSYGFRAVLPYSCDEGGGVKFAINGSITADYIWFQINAIKNAGTPVLVIGDRHTALGSSSAYQAAGHTFGHCVIEGEVDVTVAGELRVQFAQSASVGTSNIKKGAMFDVFEIA